MVAAFRLLILTGCRLREIQTLKWAYVNGAYLELPDSKTGARRIPLPPTAQRLLDALPRDPETPYVIAGALAGQHVTDLRHTYASNAVMQGMSLQMVGKLLGHSQIQTTMRYAHLADDPVRQAAERIASGLATALESTSARLNLRVIK